MQKEAFDNPGFAKSRSFVLEVNGKHYKLGWDVKSWPPETIAIIKEISVRSPPLLLAHSAHLAAAATLVRCCGWLGWSVD